MAIKHPRLPRDVNQRAKMLLDLATGAVKVPDPMEGKDPAAVSLGKRGGKAGGPARAAKLSPERRSEIAKLASAGRWGETPKKPKLPS